MSVYVTAVCCQPLHDLASLRRFGIDRGTIAEREAYTDFVRGVNTVAALSHPNILHTIGMCMEPDNAVVPRYLLTEEVTCSLKEFCERLGRSLSIEEFELIFGNCLEALLFMHSQSPPVIHCGIRSSTMYVCVSADGGLQCVKTGEHAVGRFVRDQLCQDLVSFRVDLRYFPIDVIHDTLDVRVDVYAFGLTMCELVAMYMMEPRGQPIRTSSQPPTARVQEASSWLCAHPDMRLHKYGDVIPKCCLNRQADRPFAHELASLVGNHPLAVSQL